MANLQPPSLLATVQGRQHAVTAALRFTEGTALAPSEREMLLLERFVHGDLTLDQVLNCLEKPDNEALCA